MIWKKTLQKELKFQTLPNESSNSSLDLTSSPSISVSNGKATNSDYQSNKSETSPKSDTALNEQINSVSKSSLTPKKSASSTSSVSSNAKKNSQLTSALDDVNFKYLKHVVLKFLTCREYEVILNASLQ